MVHDSMDVPSNSRPTRSLLNLAFKECFTNNDDECTLRLKIEKIKGTTAWFLTIGLSAEHCDIV